MKHWLPVVIVLLAIAGWQVGGWVQWVQSEWATQRAAIAETQGKIDRLADEASQALKSIQSVLDRLGPRIREMESDASSID